MNGVLAYAIASSEEGSAKFCFSTIDIAANINSSYRGSNCRY